MKRIIILTIFSLFILSCSHQQTENNTIEKTIEKYASENLLNGSILIAQKDSIIFKASFGYANIETKDTITDSTLFAIGSVTKQFTATAVMILQQQGKLSVNDAIGKYLNVPSTMQNIPIKNFMSMTSGIFNYWENDVPSNKDSILDFHFNGDTMYFKTNTKYHYNNSNYFFLGLLVEKVSGMSYHDFLKENIFIPAGMERTFAYNGDTVNRAIGYDENWNMDDYLITTADGCIISTVHDLYAWDKALTENKILSKENQQLMFEPQQLENGTFSNYGFGWEINSPLKKPSLFSYLVSKIIKSKAKKNDVKIVSHTGNISAFGAYNQYDTENDIYFILLSNQIRPELYDLVSEINVSLNKN